MKKSMYLLACLITVMCMPIYSVKADTLDAVLNDVVNDIIVSEKNGTCKANPYLLTASRKHAVAKCNPVVAQCPTGATLLPISKCTLRPTSTDASILSKLKQVIGATNLGNPLEGETINKIGLQCITDAGYVQTGGFDPSVNGIGYSPFCFFDMSKLGKIPVGVKQYARPMYINFGQVGMSNGATLTLSEFNNPGNWVCYSANYKATARCLTLPTGLLGKLGIK